MGIDTDCLVWVLLILDTVHVRTFGSVEKSNSNKNLALVSIVS